jgi:hypothetical protein
MQKFPWAKSGKIEHGWNEVFMILNKAMLNH